jgi:hypothetical protein
MRRLLEFTLLFVLACSPSDEPVAFAVVAPYDTVAVVGRPDEPNPLLVYRSPGGIQLIDERTVLYADNAGGVLTAVNLVTGEGWQVRDVGGSGPGEFGGSVPWFSESGGRIYTAAIGGQASTRSLDGELVESASYPRAFIGSGGFGMPSGFLDSGVVVVAFQEDPDWSSYDTQSLTRGIRAQGREGGQLWSYVDLPPALVRIEDQEGGAKHTVPVGDQQGVSVDARHGTIAFAMGRDRWVRTLSPDGSVRGEVELPYEVYSLFVDADERIWVQVRARNESRTGSYVVLDSELNTLFEVTERGVQDALGDYIVTIGFDENDVIQMYLLKRASVP